MYKDKELSYKMLHNFNITLNGRLKLLEMEFLVLFLALYRSVEISNTVK